MRFFSLITALVVAAVLYAIVMERDRLFAFAGKETPTEDSSAAPATTVMAADAGQTADTAVRVMAMHSEAQEIDSAVFLRGETEAMREVIVRAETDGKVISDPLRKGTMVEAGQMLCTVDPGTSGINLRQMNARLAEAHARLPEAAARLLEAEAAVPASRARIAEAEAAVPAAEASLLQARAGVPAAEARLLEAKARVPESEARLLEAKARIPESEARLAEAEAAVPAAEAALAEAQARLPEAQARLQEAKARVIEAEINLNAADKLQAGGFAARTRLASAQAANEAAKAGVQTALAGLSAASSGIEGAKGRLQGALAGVKTATSQVESSRAGVRSAESQIQNALAGVQNAESQLEGARATVESAKSNVEGAKAAVILARAQLEGSEAGVKAAQTGEESARSAIQAAEAAIASAEKDIERLGIPAPFAGLLETDTAELGALLQPGAACATVIQLDPIKIVAFVPEAQVARVKHGAFARARLVDDSEVFGQVTFVARSADQLTRTFRVELTLPNADLAIRDGQTADIAIEADGALAHLIPQSSLTLDNDGRLGVRHVGENSTAQFLPVRLLRDSVDGIWVAGLPDKVDIITVGQEYVTDGVPIAPSFEEVLQ